MFGKSRSKSLLNRSAIIFDVAAEQFTVLTMPM